MYDDSFFTTINQWSLNSAEVVVPEILRTLRGAGFTDTASVADFGCGQGVWLKVFEDHGLTGFGFDGDYVDTEKLWIVPERFTPVDFDKEIPTLDQKWDLAVSLEVAEHIAPEMADDFVEMLTEAADIVIFSAAIPDQGGTGHVNEQWPAYWAEKFAARGFSMSGDLRWRIWNDDRVSAWYKQNLMVCSRYDLYLSGQHPAVVHPTSWECTHVNYKEALARPR